MVGLALASDFLTPAEILVVTVMRVTSVMVVAGEGMN
jgi:hypothetical protein